MGIEVQCSELERREVKIFGEMCVFSLIYSYVADCRFCIIHCHYFVLLFIILFTVT